MSRKTRTHQSRTAGPIATALHAIADAISAAATAHAPAPAPASAPERLERMAVRHLSAEHYGRWIDLPPRRASTEAAAETKGGRLVGIRTTIVGLDARTPVPPAPSRILVVQSGTRVDEFTCDVNEPVDVAPRAWS